MKLTFFLDKAFKPNSVKPRDIRNLVVAVLDKNGYKGMIDIVSNKNKTKSTQSKFIYVKPKPKSFEILCYGFDVNILATIEELLLHRDIRLSKNKVKVVACHWDDETYTIPHKTTSTTTYKTITPIVITINTIEHKVVYNLSNKDTKEQYHSWIVQKIKEIITLQVKEFFTKTINLDDLDITILEDKKITISSTSDKKVYNQAVYMEFSTNYILPRFVGYSNGLGYGEIK